MKPCTLRRLFLPAFSLLLSACSTLPPAGIVPVSGFELQRYSGKWYEIARLDHVFERGLSDVSARYIPAPDGEVRVINRGYDTAGARWKQAEGRARFNGQPDVASLKVSFFGPFYGGYHVLALDPDYRWALVAGNDRSYLWILARDKTLDPEVKTRLLQQAAALGFETDKLIWVSQTRTD
ncbi:lipocalin family protein [Craterilacuibacter sinensis]|uniref:Outer membrane lipoprotein Blc n=1 Tax=Craterilacuibacter sinensis TaxID=2686017 RepID=A0A845BNQ0_9NEIS|nr:lipocalin family protein [Craterilacuibacter sinensis]MXR36884.1 lipocalin [Craterilacuibacter sinensis]